MARRKFNDGQEVLNADLSAVSAAIERGLYDRYFKKLLADQNDAFFKGGFVVSRLTASSIRVAAGLGIQNVSGATSPEPTQQPLVLAANEDINLTAAHATLNRIDIVCVKAQLATELSDTRRFKDADDGTITDETMVIQQDWGADVIVVDGTAHASPSAPSTPAGYLRIASLLITAATGLASSSDITDERAIITLGKPSGYDAIVGSGAECSDATLAAAIARVSAGAKILVTANEAVAATIVISKSNLQIDFKPGVVFSKDGTTIGIQLDNVDRCRINGGKFSGWGTAGDKAIQIKANCDYNFVRDCLFAGNATDIDDLSTTSSILGTLAE